MDGWMDGMIDDYNNDGRFTSTSVFYDDGKPKTTSGGDGGGRVGGEGDTRSSSIGSCSGRNDIIVVTTVDIDIDIEIVENQT